MGGKIKIEKFVCHLEINVNVERLHEWLIFFLCHGATALSGSGPPHY
jgi:hypothetical protein